MKKKLVKLTILLVLMFMILDRNSSNAKAMEITDNPDDTYMETSDSTEESSGTEGETADGTSSDAADGNTATQDLPVSQITIAQNPIKVTYTKGESLDLTGMVVDGYFLDGTVGPVTGYEVIGYNCNQIGPQTVIVLYQNQMALFTVNVIPAKVSGVSVYSSTSASLTLTWDLREGITRYEVYCLDNSTGEYQFLSYAYTNSITYNYMAGTQHSYRIRAVENVLGIDYMGEFSDTVNAATNPDMVTNITVTGTTVSSISLSWPQVYGATGYLVYRSPADTENYELCSRTDVPSYTDKGLYSGQGYKYKVCAFTYSAEFVGLYSPVADVSTNPAKMVLKYKAGDQKIRLTWSKINGADSYDFYMDDGTNGFTLLTSSNGNSGGTYIAQGLVTGNTYKLYAVAHRKYNGLNYDSPASDEITVVLNQIEGTSSSAKLFSTEEDFLKSWTYQKLPFFSNYVNYSKSYIIPGLNTTNVGGFLSTSMCPQGITFAGNYLLVSAYDIAGEENSVIYVLKKTTRKLLTTLILPSNPHAGGICYDGSNIWITNSSKVSSIRYSDVLKAVKSGEPYVNVNYNTVNSLGIITSYVTYYGGKLWVGSYNELNTTFMYSYEITNKDTAPVLTKKDKMAMPTRVQGVAFTKLGTMILSRSCQLYSGLRGYMRQLDSYKPDLTKKVNGVIQLGDLLNTVSMPSMNEGIAIDGTYLYVNFESGAFADSSYKMDRICAFKLNDVVYKKEIVLASK